MAQTPSTLLLDRLPVRAARGDTETAQDRLFRVLVRARWAVLLVWAAVLFPRDWTIGAGDWHYFVTGSDALAASGPDGGLSVFAQHPELHMGPLSLVAAWVLRLGGGDGLTAAVILMWALGPVILVLLERTAVAVRGLERAGDDLLLGLTTLFGGVLFLGTWMEAAGPVAHLDDVLAMAFVALAVRAISCERPFAAGAAVGLAVAAKPWGVLLLPLCLALPWWRARLQAGVAALAVMLLAWLPFVVADRGTIAAGSYNQLNDLASGLRAVGIDTLATPTWVRPTQVLVALVLGLIAIRRGRWPAVVAVALAARIALDPAVFPYYTPTLVLGALVWDLVAARRPFPLWTLVTYVALTVAPVAALPDAVLGQIRFAAALGLVLGALLLPSGCRAASVHRHGRTAV